MKTLKYIINWIFFLCIFIPIFIFSNDNKNLMILNLFPFKVGIEMPVYLYSFILAFIFFSLGVIVNTIYIKTENFKNKRKNIK